MTETRVFAVDDDPDILRSIAIALQPHGIVVETLSDPTQLLPRVPVGDVLLLDLNFRRGANTNQEGLRLIEDVRAKDRDVAIVVITAFGGMGAAIDAMKRGADDFIAKPWSNPQLVAKVREAGEIARARRRAPDAASATTAPPLVAESAAILAVQDSLRRIAGTSLSVLIFGETGVGKTRLAHEIFSPQAPLTPFSETSPLSDDDQPIFVRELNDLTPGAQARLLAHLNQRPRRVICTTNHTRDELRHRIRADLLSRIAGVEVFVPPLRERPDDAAGLLLQAVRHFENKHNRPARQMHENVDTAARMAAWPGGARGVLQAAERAATLSTGDVYAPEDFGLTAEVGAAPPSGQTALVDIEAEAVRRALADNGYNVSHAAKQLGISRAALYRRMEKHGI